MGQITKKIYVVKGSTIDWKVYKDGYHSKQGTYKNITNDHIERVVLEKLQARYNISLTTQPIDADVKIQIISGEGKIVGNNVIGITGTKFSWEVSKEGYISQRGVYTITDHNDVINVILTAIPKEYTITLSVFPEDSDVNIQLMVGEGQILDKKVIGLTGTQFHWVATRNGYISKEGSYIIQNHNDNIDIVLEERTYAEEFVFTINSGDDKSFILPLSSSYSITNNLTSYNMNVDWGDGQTETITGTSSMGHGVTHTYETVNKEYDITLTPASEDLDGWGCQFGFGPLSEGCNTGINKDKVRVIKSPYTRYMIMKESSNNSILSQVWGGCSNLTLGEKFNIPQDITAVGFDFCSWMFSACTSLTTLPVDFNLPPSILTIGDYFCGSMFENCSSLVSLPTNFNIPQGIQENIPNFFCIRMFSGCSSLASLPTNFNIPQNTVSTGQNFCQYMFNGCQTLSSLPSTFNFPQTITKVGNGFGSHMFQECSNLTTLPETFAVPKAIAGGVGDDLYAYMFYNCSSLKSLPESFTLEFGWHRGDGMGNGFCQYMFFGCSSLTSISSMFTIPGWYYYGDDTCTRMFFGCSSLKSLPEGFALPHGDSAGINCCSYMFYKCSSLETLPSTISRPNSRKVSQNMYKNNYNAYIFAHCTSLKTGIIDFFMKYSRKQVDQTHLNWSGVYDHAFFNCTANTETISADTIDQLKILPSRTNSCFKGTPNTENCPTNWK